MHHGHLFPTFVGMNRTGRGEAPGVVVSVFPTSVGMTHELGLKRGRRYQRADRRCHDRVC